MTRSRPLGLWTRVARWWWCGRRIRWWLRLVWCLSVLNSNLVSARRFALCVARVRLLRARVLLNTFVWCRVTRTKVGGRLLVVRTRLVVPRNRLCCWILDAIRRRYGRTNPSVNI